MVVSVAGPPCGLASQGTCADMVSINHQTLDRDYWEAWCEHLGFGDMLRVLWTTATSED